MFGLFSKKKRIIAKMEEWLSHPNEFGDKPDFSEIVHQGKIFHPGLGMDVDSYLIYYKYMEKNEDGIGCVGPLTWSFFDVTLKGVNLNALMSLYEGWNIAFHCVNHIEQRAIHEEDLTRIKQLLLSEGKEALIGSVHDFGLHQTTNSNGDHWLTMPVEDNEVKDWVSFTYAAGDERITIMPSLIGEFEGPFAHYAYIASLMQFHRFNSK